MTGFMSERVQAAADNGTVLVGVLCLALVFLFFALQRKPPRLLKTDPAMLPSTFFTGVMAAALLAGLTGGGTSELIGAGLAAGAAYGLFCSFVRQRPARSGSLHLVRSFIEFIIAAAAVFYATTAYFELAAQSSAAGLPRPFWTAAYIALLAAAFIAVLPNTLHKMGSHGSILDVGMCTYAALVLLTFCLAPTGLGTLGLPGDRWIWAIAGVAVVLIASVLAPGAVTVAGGLFLLLGGVLLDASVGADFSPSSLVSASVLGAYAACFWLCLSLTQKVLPPVVQMR